MEGLGIDSFFRNKRILITGDTGFKGSWLALWLSEIGAQTIGYSLPAERMEDHFHLLNIREGFQHVDGDLGNQATLLEVFRSFQPEICFHLAAQSLVSRSYKDPGKTFAVNIGGGVNLLEAIRSTLSVRSIVFVTSDKCYKNREWIWSYRESDELGGIDPYSASKSAIEIVFESYRQSIFPREKRTVGLATARAGNVVGGGDWAEDRIVPDTIRALRSGRPLVLRNPASTRPWQHVMDPLYGYLLLAKRLYEQPDAFGGAWNFGPDCTIVRSVGDVVKAIASEWKPVEIQAGSVTSFHESRLLNVNWEKASRLLGWSPLWNFERTIKETTEWYKRVHDGENSAIVSRQQLLRYRKERSHG